MLKVCHLLLCGETKLLMEVLTGEHGRRCTRSRGGQPGSQIPQAIRSHASWGSSAFRSTKMFPFADAGHSAQPPPKKEKQAPHPPHSSLCDLSPLMMKVCLYLWGNFAGCISDSHAALTL